MNPRNKNTLWLLIATALTLLAGAVVILGVVPRLRTSPGEVKPASQVGYPSAAVQAEVVAVLEEGKTQVGNVEQTYQLLRIRLLQGEWAGTQLEIDYGKRQTRPEGLNLAPGDRILVLVNKSPDGFLQAYFLDFVRTRPLFWLFFTFIAFSIAVSGWKGVRGLLGMAISLAVIVYYVIPQILQGRDPVWVSISGAFALLAITLYLIYGWTLKTHAAVLGTLLSLVLTALLADFFVGLTRLTGYGSEEALFLMQQTGATINLRGLVLGGMLIGALGVLDDLVITQASVVFELHQLNPALKAGELYRRGLRVGRDHVAATINTLVLAYTGAALPMLLLFTLSGEQYTYLLNLEFVTEEIVRTLIGSLGLIAAVPLTTLLAALVAAQHHRLGTWARFLGPASGEDSHSHG
ncbi:MAG: YibE/F family protein [Anaerolineae bacterium]|nr:MAG: YibE/F family protein [Anaerolineae bacterium]